MLLASSTYISWLFLIVTVAWKQDDQAMFFLTLKVLICQFSRPSKEGKCLDKHEVASLLLSPPSSNWPWSICSVKKTNMFCISQDITETNSSWVCFVRASQWLIFHHQLCLHHVRPLLHLPQSVVKHTTNVRDAKLSYLEIEKYKQLCNFSMCDHGHIKIRVLDICIEEGNNWWPSVANLQCV